MADIVSAIEGRVERLTLRFMLYTPNFCKTVILYKQLNYCLIINYSYR